MIPACTNNSQDCAFKLLKGQRLILKCPKHGPVREVWCNLHWTAPQKELVDRKNCPCCGINKSNTEGNDGGRRVLSFFFLLSHGGDLLACQLLMIKSREKWHLEKDKHTGSCQQSSYLMTGPDQLFLWSAVYPAGLFVCLCNSFDLKQRMKDYSQDYMT